MPAPPFKGAGSPERDLGRKAIETPLAGASTCVGSAGFRPERDLGRKAIETAWRDRNTRRPTRGVPKGTLAERLLRPEHEVVAHAVHTEVVPKGTLAERLLRPS